MKNETLVRYRNISKDALKPVPISLVSVNMDYPCSGAGAVIVTLNQGLDHAILLPCLLKRFCYLLGVKESDLFTTVSTQESTHFKRLFIATVYELHSSQLSCSIRKNLINANLVDGLSRLFKTDKAWISRHANDIKRIFNSEETSQTDNDFIKQILTISAVLENEFKD